MEYTGITSHYDQFKTILDDMEQAGCSAEQRLAVTTAFLARQHEAQVTRHQASHASRQRRYRQKLKQNQRTSDASLTVTDDHRAYLYKIDDVKIDDVRTDEVAIDDVKIHDVKTDDGKIHDVEVMYVEDISAKTVPVTVENGSQSHFEVFWQAFPNKIGKGYARKCFDKAHKKASLQEMLDGVNRYIADRPDDRLWCNPSTWLNQERWLDQPGAEPITRLFAKPPTIRQAIIGRNDQLTEEFSNGTHPLCYARQNPKSGSTGSPTHEIIPPNGNPDFPGIQTGNGQTDNRLFGGGHRGSLRSIRHLP